MLKTDFFIEFRLLSMILETKFNRTNVLIHLKTGIKNRET